MWVFKIGRAWLDKQRLRISKVSLNVNGAGYCKSICDKDFSLLFIKTFTSISPI